MTFVWKEQHGEARQKERTEAKFLVHAVKIYEETSRELSDITGARVALPVLAINPNPRKGNFGEIVLSNNSVKILLNPGERLEKPQAAHELVHVARLSTIGRLLTGTDMIVEEAFSIIGESAILAMRLPKTQARRAVIDGLQEGTKKPDSLTAAEWIAKEFKRQSERDALQFGSAFGSSGAKPGELLRAALAKAESHVDRSQWEDPRHAATKHKIGAGLALMLFLANDSDPVRSIKAAVETKVADLLTEVAEDLMKGGKSRIIAELQRLRG